MCSVCGNDAPNLTYFQVKFLSKLCRRGRDPWKLELDTVRKVKNFVLQDWLSKIFVIANEVCKSKTSVLKYLHDDLKSTEICQENLLLGI